MTDSYTRNISDFILDLPDREIAAIWEDIETMPLDTTAMLWRKKLEKIARENVFSGRFALMRILYSRAKKLPIAKPDETEIPASADSFEICFGEKKYLFRDISMEHAEALTPQEHLDYIACLTELASRQADSDPQVNERIISRAWYDTESANAVAYSQLPGELSANPKRLKRVQTGIDKDNRKNYQNRLTREEAFLLGHILDFSLEEMQWFLLRVFDAEDGFRFNISGDLIEAYGFMTRASWQHVCQIQEAYTQRSAGIAKQDDPHRNNRWTRNISDTLPGKVAQWMLSSEAPDDKFLEWMLAQTPGLDLPSHTARRIYRNLAAFAHDLILDAERIPSDESFVDCIRDVYQESEESGAVQRLLYENGEISYTRCKTIANRLLLENKIQSASVQSDNTKAWHILSLRKDGSLTAAGGVVNTGRTRMADILYGKVQAEKGDMLYLFWFVANLIWTCQDASTEEMRCYRLMDFMEIAKELLETAMLPAFYPPHILEQSMLLSIVCKEDSRDSDPSVVYEYMLYSTVEHRNSGKNKTV